MQIAIERESEMPLYRQIVDQIRRQIAAGVLAPGHRLPTVRRLAADLGLTRLTVHSAYAELQSEGLIESHVGRGSFVADDARMQSVSGGRQAPATSWVSEGVIAGLLRAGEDGRTISFAQTFPAPESYPAKEMSSAMQRAMRRTGSLSYGSVQGEVGLRQELVTLLLDRGLSIPPEHMLITSGAQQAIDIALRALVGPGDVVLVEEPTYPGVLELAAYSRCRMIGVPSDEGGIRLDALGAACAAYRPRLLYLVPTFHNPTGATLAPERREAVLQLAREMDLMVVEDDVYGLLPLETAAEPPLLTFDEESRVIYITSFSKVLAPALRIGALIASPSVLPALAAAKQSSDLVCSTVIQRALAEYLRRGHMGSHLEQVRRVYRERRDVMLAALERHLPECAWTLPRGGLCLWVTLPDAVSERDFVRDALDAGVGVAPGGVFHAGRPRGSHVRLSFSMQPPERIERGVEILGAVLQAHLGRRLPRPALAAGGVGPMV